MLMRCSTSGGSTLGARSSASQERTLWVGLMSNYGGRSLKSMLSAWGLRGAKASP